MMDDPTFLLLLYYWSRKRGRAPRKRPVRSLTDWSNIFEWPEHKFINEFRLSRELAWEVVGKLRGDLGEQGRMTDISPEMKVLTALRLFAQGSYQLSVARDGALYMSQTSVSNCLTEVTNAILNSLGNEWVKFPSQEDFPGIQAKFFEKFRIPGCIGCIDGTHISIIAPHNEHLYVSRKGGHSLNVQLICDDKGRITNVNARFPGSTEDAFIWKQSLARQNILELYNRGEWGSYWLAGDSEYPLEPFLLTPYSRTNTAQKAWFNERFMKLRSSIEQVKGQLKSRWRCLHKQLHYTPEKAGKIMVACCVLHNMCKARNLDEVVIDLETDDNESEIVCEVSQPLLRLGQRQRDSVAQCLKH